MRLSIVIIGDEILLGQVVDTNSGFIARSLAPDGWEVVGVSVVGDNAAAIKRTIEAALLTSDAVITTGGLGPTKDDITRSVLLDIFGGSLIHDPDVEANVRRVFERRGLDMNKLTLNQSLVPDTCRVIQNNYGTAPVMWFEHDGKVLVAMPGVPFETEGMVRDEVRRQLSRHFSPRRKARHHTYIVADITESDLATRLQPFEEALPSNIHLAYLPTPGLIRLRLDGVTDIDNETFDNVFDEYLVRLKAMLGNNFIYDGDATAPQILIEKIRHRGLTFASAESCTGGAIASAITSVAGCSDVYVGSVVSYSNDVKINVLGVNAADIEAMGAVSETVVRQMAQGVRRITGAKCAVATSGIAGPGGGTPTKPVGTVWIACDIDGVGTFTRLLHLPGNRARVIGRAVAEAMLLAIHNI